MRLTKQSLFFLLTFLLSFSGFAQLTYNQRADNLRTITGASIVAEVYPSSSSAQPQIAKQRVLEVKFGVMDNVTLPVNSSEAWSSLVNLDVVAYDSYSRVLKTVPLFFYVNEKNDQQIQTIDFTGIMDKVYFFRAFNKGYTPPSNTAIETQLYVNLKITEDIKYHHNNVVPNALKVEKCVGCLSTHVSKVKFSWGLPVDAVIADYDLQIVKVEPKADGGYSIDWSKASLIEVGPGRKNYEMTLAEGTGYYFWRVRSVGNYYDGGRANLLNFGPWTSATKPTAALYTSSTTTNTVVANTTQSGTVDVNALASVSSYYFYYQQFNETLNWSYGRVFSEGGQQSEKISFANGLNQVEQTQSKLYSSNNVIASEVAYDYSGRPVINTLPAPVNDANLGYKSSFFNLPKNKFDALNTLTSHGLTSTELGSVSDYYSSTNTVGEKGTYVPDSKTYPYSRTLFYKDASGRVFKQSVPGKAMKLDIGGNSNNVTYSYGVATDDEIDYVFGAEAPDPGTVSKTVISDPNNVTTIEYKNQSNNVIATCLSTSPAKLENIGNEPVTPLSVTEELKKGQVNKEKMVATDRKTVVLDQNNSINLAYKIKKSTLLFPCGSSVDCDYRVEIEITCPEYPAEKGRNLKLSFPISSTATPGSDGYLTLGTQIPSSSIIYTEPATGGTSIKPSIVTNPITLAKGTYIIEKRVYTNNYNTTTGKTYLEKLYDDLKTSIDNTTTTCCTGFDPKQYICSDKVESLCAAYDVANDAFYNNAIYDAFAQEMLNAISKERTGNYGTAYNKFNDLIGNSFTTTTQVKDLLNRLIKKSDVTCENIYDCFNTASKGLDANVDQFNKYGKIDANKFDDQYDLMKKFLACLGEDYGLERLSFTAGVFDFSGAKAQASADGDIRSFNNLSFENADPNYKYHQYNGQLNVKTGGTYYFWVEVDNEVNIWINGKYYNKRMLTTQNGKQWLNSAGEGLAAGKYPLLIKYKGPGSGKLKLYWGTSTDDTKASVISYEYLLPPDEKCKAYTGVIIGNSSTTETSSNNLANIKYVRIGAGASGVSSDPLNHSDPLLIKKRTCIQTYFRDQIKFTDNQVLSIPADGMTVQEAAREVCSCVNDIAERSAVSLDDAKTRREDLKNQIVKACEDNCDKKKTTFNVAIDAYISEYNNSTTLTKEANYDKLSLTWKNFNDPELFGTQPRNCQIDQMVMDCKSQCQFAGARTITDEPNDQAAYLSYVNATPLATEREQYTRAMLYPVEVAPYGTYSGGALQKQLEDQIVDFIYNTWERGINLRIKKGTLTTNLLLPVDNLRPGVSNTTSATDVYLQEVKAFKINVGTKSAPDTRDIQLVVNVVWEEGTDKNSKADDVLKYVNYYLKCGSNTNTFLYYSLNLTGTGSTCTWPNFGAAYVDLRNFVKIYFDGYGYLHTVLTDKKTCSVAYDESDQVIRNNYKGSFKLNFAGKKTGGTNATSADYALLSVTDNTKEIYLHTSNVYWKGTTEATVKEIVKQINRKGDFYAEYVVKTDLSCDITIYLPASVEIPSLAAYSLANSGSLTLSPVARADGSHFSSAEYFGSTSVSPATLSAIVKQKGCAVTTYSGKCPVEFKSLNAPALPNVTTYESAIKTFLKTNSDFYNFVYTSVDIAMRNPDIYKATKNYSIAGVNHTLTVQTNIDYSDQSPRILSVNVMFTNYLKACPTLGEVIWNDDAYSLNFNVAGYDAWKNINISNSSITCQNSLFTFTFEDYALNVNLKTNYVPLSTGPMYNNALVTCFMSCEYYFNGYNKKTTGTGTPYEDLVQTIVCNSCAVCYRYVRPSDMPVYVPQNIEQTCDEINEGYRAVQLDKHLDECFKSKKDFIKTNLNSCLDKLDDILTVTYSLSYHHYTLYYYDRADRLIKTVPPQGVTFLNAADIAKVQSYRITKTGLTVFPSHTLLTEYYYNSLGQLRKQFIPEGNIPNDTDTEAKKQEREKKASLFWYNAAGQLVLSQNAEQRKRNTGAYSYTKYDNLGRVIESGELSGFTPTFDDSDQQIISQLWSDRTFPANTFNKSDVVFTIYTTPQDVTFKGKAQENLLNRVSKTTTGTGISTYYSYDPHGNVDWIIQQLPEIGKKTIRYEYDLVSNKVRKVYYNECTREQFIHRYEYDTDNRITNVYTSVDGLVWSREAGYKYYLHGPLSRTEIGNNLQGLDYTYTIEGYLKAINHPELDNLKDPGLDGINNGISSDEFGMELGYYNGDYDRAGTNLGANSASNPYNTVLAPVPADATNPFVNNLYNGNIKYWISNTRAGNLDATGGLVLGLGRKMNVYTYDKLNRLKKSELSEYKTSAWTNNGSFKEEFSYDYNGNILTGKRNGYYVSSSQKYASSSTDLRIDDLNYSYKAGTNMLERVTDGLSATMGTSLTTDIDLKNQTETINYVYDEIGNLIEDKSEKLKITWNAQGKVRTVSNSNPEKISQIVFEYDAMGNRTIKKLLKNGVVETAWFYVRDASGNVMAIYRKNYANNQTKYVLQEMPIYGSSRIGEYKPNPELVIDDVAGYENENTTGSGSIQSELSKMLLPASDGVRIADLSLSVNAGCESTTYTSRIISGVEVLECRSVSLVTTSVSAGSDFLVKSNGVIRLEPGFHAERNSRFHAYGVLAASGEGDINLTTLGTTTSTLHTSTVLDESGELLVGSYVKTGASSSHILLNRKLEQIPVPTEIGGAISANTSLNASPIYVRNPENKRRYYFIYPDVGSSANGPLRYIEVDLNANGGSGKVISSAINSVGTASYAFPMVPVELKDGNTRIYTMQSDATSVTLSSILVTPDGFQKQEASYTYTTGYAVSAASDMAISPDGKLLAMTLTRTPAIDFTNTTAADILVWNVDVYNGTYTYKGAVNIPSGDVNNVEFSPDSKFIYYTAGFGSTASSQIGRVSLADLGTPGFIKTLNGYKGYADILRTAKGSLIVSKGIPLSTATPQGLLEINNPGNAAAASLIYTENEAAVKGSSAYYTYNLPRQTLFFTGYLKGQVASELKNWIIPGTTDWVNGTNTASGVTMVENRGMNFTASPSYSTDAAVALGKSVAIAEDSDGKAIYKFYTAGGLNATYTKAPSYGGTITRLEPGVNNIWDKNPVPSYVNYTDFSVTYTGSIYIPAAGTYNFYSNSSDRFYVKIGGVKQIEYTGTTANTDELSKAVLFNSAGWYDFEMYVNNTSGQAITNLLWSSDNFGKQEVYSEFFSPTRVTGTTTVTYQNSQLTSNSGIPIYQSTAIKANAVNAAIFAKAPEDDNTWFLFTGYGGKIYYHTIQDNNIMAANQPLMVGATELSSANAAGREQFSLAVYQDLNVNNKSKLIVGVNQGNQVKLYQFDLTQYGPVYQALINTYTDETSSGKVHLGEIQVSPSGRQFSVAVSEYDQPSGKNLNKLEIYQFSQYSGYACSSEYSETNKDCFRKSIIVSAEPGTGAAFYGSILSHDYSSTGKHIYFIAKSCPIPLGLSSCNASFTNVQIWRTDVSVSNLSSNASAADPVAPYSTYAFSGNYTKMFKVAIRRAPDQKMYYSYCTSNKLYVYSSDDSYISNTVTRELISFSNSLNAGFLPLQPFIIHKKAAKSPFVIGIANRKLDQRLYELTDHLGNVRVVIGDAKVVKSAAGVTPKIVGADVRSFTDYYAFGMDMPDRSFSNHMYGFNGQEKVDEIALGHTTAKFWEYDSRVGNRWNTDPKPSAQESPYATNRDNPIWYNDPDGDCPPGTICGGKLTVGLTLGTKGQSRFNVAAGFGISKTSGSFMGGANLSLNLYSGGPGTNQASTGESSFGGALTLGLSGTMGGGKGTPSPLNIFNSSTISGITNNFENSGTIGTNLTYNTATGYNRASGIATKFGGFTATINEDFSLLPRGWGPLASGKDEGETGGGFLGYTLKNGTSIYGGTEIFTGAPARYPKGPSLIFPGYVAQSMAQQRLNVGRTFLKLDNFQNISELRIDYSGQSQMWSQNLIHDKLGYKRFRSTAEDSFQATVNY